MVGQVPPVGTCSFNLLFNENLLFNNMYKESIQESDDDMSIVENEIDDDYCSNDNIKFDYSLPDLNNSSDFKYYWMELNYKIYIIFFFEI